MEIDVLRQIGAVTRQVATRDHKGRPARVVVATRRYNADINDVWDAITRPERIPRWFMPVSGDLRLGGRYQLQGNAGGEITRCEPPRNLAMTWEFGGGVSWVSVTLAPDPAGGTRLELEHTAHVDDHWEQFGPGAVGVGWELGLFGLGEHLASGAAVDPQAVEAWTTSEAGKTFIRGSSEGWGEAAIADGDPPDAARAAAERTTAFYTGADAPSAG